MYSKVFSGLEYEEDIEYDLWENLNEKVKEESEMGRDLWEKTEDKRKEENIIGRDLWKQNDEDIAERLNYNSENVISDFGNLPNKGRTSGKIGYYREREIREIKEPRNKVYYSDYKTSKYKYGKEHYFYKNNVQKRDIEDNNIIKLLAECLVDIIKIILNLSVDVIEIIIKKIL